MTDEIILTDEELARERARDEIMADEDAEELASIQADEELILTDEELARELARDDAAEELASIQADEELARDE